MRGPTVVAGFARIAACAAAVGYGSTACRHERAREPVARDAPLDHGVVTDARPSDVTRDASTARIDAGVPRALTIRVINVGNEPMPILTNPDTNEIIHTRKLRDHPQPDASPATREGELVKFFPVGQEPMCGADAGAGYGGLGQPEPRTLAPGESLEFAWDGKLRREVLGGSGVCQQITEPEPGRYRFEFDQPYNIPACRPVIVTLPLTGDAPRQIELRCVPRPPRHD